MIKRIFKRFTCKHLWKCTYVGLVERTYTCVKCGKANVVKSWNDGKWRIRQGLKGGDVE